MTIKVLIVDDSAFMRAVISRMLTEDPDIEVVGTARNGRDGVRKVMTLNPDVVTMDVEMPDMNGLEAVESIMTECPTPVVMFSSLTTRGADVTIEALGKGAVDFVAKPGTAASELESIGKELVTKVRMASNVRVRGPLRPLTGPLMQVSVPTHGTENVVGAGTPVKHIVGIGTSTGGPRALEAVLRTLPASLPCAITVVQHMPPTFTRSLAERLNRLCQITVVEAEQNQTLQNGVAYIAPGGQHMEVVERRGQYQILLHEGPKRHEHRPSVDVLFESLSTLSHVKRSLVLMTGMGTDGAEGMHIGKRAGSETIAESEGTCVVYGMPKAAISLGCVDYILPLNKIGAKVVELVTPLERTR